MYRSRPNNKTGPIFFFNHEIFAHKRSRVGHIPDPNPKLVSIKISAIRLYLTLGDKHRHHFTLHRISMKMGSVTMSFASILANGCRSISPPVSLVRTLATTHVALSKKHHNKHLVAAWSSGCSNISAFACESSKSDVIHAATTTSVNGYVKVKIFIASILLGACNFGFCFRFG